MNRQTEDIINLIFKTSCIVRKKMAEVGEAGGITFGHIKVLRFINEEKNPTMKKVADYLVIASPSATALINQLVDRGDLKRTFDSGDRRVVRLAITAQGKKELDLGMGRMKQRLGELLTELDHAQINNLKEILETLSKNYGNQ